MAEIDGTMLPVVLTAPGKDGNARQDCRCPWKETRLAAARIHALADGAASQVLQKRLKISGAWWKHDNLIEMAYLSVCRAIRKEHLYWTELKRAA